MSLVKLNSSSPLSFRSRIASYRLSTVLGWIIGSNRGLRLFVRSRVTMPAIEIAAGFSGQSTLCCVEESSCGRAMVREAVRQLRQAVLGHVGWRRCRMWRSKAEQTYKTYKAETKFPLTNLAIQHIYFLHVIKGWGSR